MAKRLKTAESKSVLRILRVSLASVIFSCFTLLLLDFGGVFDRYLGFLPKLEFWPAVLRADVAALVLLTVLTMCFGRVYCSVLCPLGIMQDGIYRLRISGKKSRCFKQGWTRPVNWLRYGFLALFIVLVCLGYGFAAYLVEPYSIFGRMVTSVTGKAVPLMLVSAASFALIAILVWKGGRTWCNSVCPVGTILGLLSRWSLFRPLINDSKCVGCGLCGKACRANCIDTVNHIIDSSRCVVCFDCIDNCSSGAIDFKWRMGSGASSASPAPSASTASSASTAPSASPASSDGKTAIDRRAFLAVGALAFSSVAAKAVEEGHGGLAALAPKQTPARKKHIVPPGSGSYRVFNTKCVGCQLCVSACPNDVLRPSVEIGEHFLQPVMGYEKGWCRPECTVCSQVCPTGAIKALTPEEKSSISIGHAVYVPERCVVVTDEVKCGNCARHCPSGAISMVKYNEDSALRIPVVNPERCIGCGHCEYVCPSRPLSAIYVEGNDTHREI